MAMGMGIKCVCIAHNQEHLQELQALCRSWVVEQLKAPHSPAHLRPADLDKRLEDAMPPTLAEHLKKQAPSKKNAPLETELEKKRSATAAGMDALFGDGDGKKLKVPKPAASPASAAEPKEEPAAAGSNTPATPPPAAPPPAQPAPAVPKTPATPPPAGSITTPDMSALLKSWA